VGKTVPKVRIEQARKTMISVTNAIDSGYVKSCHDLSEGGLAVAAAEMALSGDRGVELDLKNVPKSSEIKRNDYILFSESNSRFLVEVAEENREDFEKLMEGNIFSAVGRVKKSDILSVNGIGGEQIVDVHLTGLRNAWKSAFGGKT